MEYSINLIENNEVSIAFTKANTALLNKYSVNDNDTLIELWQKEYGVDLVLPEKLVFANNKDLTMFLLRWS